MPELQQLIFPSVTAVVTGVLIAGLSSWITVWLSSRRFRRENWWGRKADTYAAVIEAIHNSKEFSDLHLDAEYENRTVSEQKGRELRERAKAANTEIRRVTDISAFLLSEAAVLRLKRFQSEMNEASHAPSWHEYLEFDNRATKSCLEDMIRIARSDLRI